MVCAVLSIGKSYISPCGHFFFSACFPDSPNGETKAPGFFPSSPGYGPTPEEKNLFTLTEFSLSNSQAHTSLFDSVCASKMQWLKSFTPNVEKARKHKSLI